MKVVEVLFTAVISDEMAEDLEAADPALEYEYVAELAEHIDEHAKTSIRWVGSDDG